MSLIEQLGQTGKQEFQNLHEQLNLDQETLQQAIELFLLYKPSINIISIASKICVWLASTRQILKAIDGTMINGSGLTLNQIVTRERNYEEFFMIGEEILSSLQADLNTQTIFMMFKNQYKFYHMIHMKLQQLFDNFQYNDIVKDYPKLLRTIAWILFADAKKRMIITNDVVEATCLCASVMHLILSQTIQNAQVSKGFSELKKLSQQNYEQFSIDLLNHLIQYFKIKDLDLFNKINEQFHKLFSDLIKQQAIKCLQTNHYNNSFLNGSIINSNYLRLEQYYNKSLSYDELDARIIIQDRLSQMTPQKINPFIINAQPDPIKSQQHQRLIQNNLQNTDGINKFQRLLNYEMDQINIKKAALNEIKLPGKVQISAYAQQNVMATPMTAAMEMYNWLHEKHQVFKKFLKISSISFERISIEFPDIMPSISSCKDLKQLDTIFERTVDQAQQLGLMEASQNKRSLYWTFYISILEEYLNNEFDEQSLINNAESILVVSIEAVNFILGFQNTSIEQLSQSLKIVQFQIWRILDFLLNEFDPKCPIQLKGHILDVETRFISHHIWVIDKNSDLLKFVASQQQTKSDQFQRVFKRVLHYCAYQIQALSNNLQLNEQISEQVWHTTKFILSEKLGLILKHSLDQIVLSSFYAVLKMVGNPLKFQSLIISFESINTHYNKSFLKKIMTQVYLTSNHQSDIVTYYNQIFIPVVKAFLIHLSVQNKIPKSNNQNFKNTPISSKNPALSQQILQSPLKSILPVLNQQNQLIFQSKQQIQQTHVQSKNPALMTPSTQLLYAYTESPLLKTSNKIEKENQMNNQNLVYNQRGGTTNMIVKQNTTEFSQNTADFITKKCIINYSQFSIVQQIKEQKTCPTQNSFRQQSNNQFSIMSQGTPKVLNTSNRNNVSSQNNVQNASIISSNREKTQESNISQNYCKLLNFE